MEIIINAKDRNIVVKKAPDVEIIVNEGDTIKYNFLPGTEDTFDVILKFMEVEHEDGSKTLEPFTHRADNPDWVMKFIPEEYEL